MKKFFLVFIYLIILCAPKAQVRTSYFPYIKEKIELSDWNFKRYIIPQLRAITREYYHILRKLHPMNKYTIEIYQQLSSTQRTFKDFKSGCNHIDNDCLEHLKGLYLQNRKLDQLILKLESKHINLEESNSMQETDSLLALLHSLNNMGNQNFRLMHALEQYLMTVNTSFFAYNDDKSIIGPSIHKMLVSSELMLPSMLGTVIKDDFYSVWSQFFKEIDKKILHDQDKVYLIRHLEELNIAWNTFHMRMSRENDTLPKSIISLIKIMHNRWNSCLKIVLR